VFALPCVAACVPEGSAAWALLATATGEDASWDAKGQAEAALTVFADALTVRRRLEAAEQERDEWAGFALAGQALTGLAHELNNVLNSVVLQASVLEMQLDERFHAALDVIRRQTLQATGLLQPLGQVSAARAKASYAIDLTDAVREVLQHDPEAAARVHFVPPAGAIPPIRGLMSAVKQLTRLLLAAATAASRSVIQVRTAAEGAGVQLIAEYRLASGAHAPGDVPLTADNVVWSRLDDLERLAGQSLLRQSGGELHVESRPEGGFALRVCWAAAPAGEERPNSPTPPPVEAASSQTAGSAASSHS
jgi:signal transduction histidine kinase